MSRPVFLRHSYRVYLTGPKPDDNEEAFNKAAERLRGLGHQVYSPIIRNDDERFEIVEPSGNVVGHFKERRFNLRSALARDSEWVCRKADAIAVLPNWESSRGASAAVALGRALELPIAPVEAFWPSGPDPRALL